MSTVLRPVGPHEPRVYWIRRAILLAVIAIVIVVIAAECSGGSGKKGNGGSSRSASQPSQPTISPTPTKTAIPPCIPSSLKLKLSTDTTTYTSGQSPELIGDFTNTSTTKCRLVRSAANEVWAVKSGPPTVWTTKGCPTNPPTPKRLTIAPGTTKRVSVFWNGRLRTSSCIEGAVATAGVYRLDATLDGVTGKTAVFRIQ